MTKVCMQGWSYHLKDKIVPLYTSVDMHNDNGMSLQQMEK